MQLLTAYTRLFWRARAQNSPGACDIALHLANKCTTLLPEDSEQEYSNTALASDTETLVHVCTQRCLPYAIGRSVGRSVGRFLFYLFFTVTFMSLN